MEIEEFRRLPIGTVLIEEDQFITIKKSKNMTICVSDRDMTAFDLAGDIFYFNFKKTELAPDWIRDLYTSKKPLTKESK